MKIYIEEDYNALSKRAADVITSFLKENPEAVLGLPTDGTSKKTYEILSEKCKKREISFKKIKTFNLDEYSGLPAEHPQSFHFAMKKNLFSKVDIDIKNTFFPDDFKPDYKKYDQEIKNAGGIDLQILGIGRNGHIAFNEPGSEFDSKTREISLTETTIKDNSRFFESMEDVPKKAVTMGIDTIMQAKKIILLASGENKSDAIFGAIEGPVSTEVPASIIQRHKNVIVILDKDSAKKLTKKGL
ncbi:MAG: glucosamine-6-phosphate deaminase [Candidatus Staskawiczbacteria bacterium]|nr:glucosamine-6-phosphate deaminase [Candidatus Staskawiczbacteria bacterium]